MNKGKSVIFLIIWFTWAAGQDLDAIVRHSIKSDYYIFSSIGIVPMYFVLVFLVFILNISSLYYLIRPSYMGLRVALSALVIAVFQNALTMFFALKDIKGVREAYAKGREIRGLPVRDDILDIIFTPSALYLTFAVMLVMYVVVAFFVMKNKKYFYQSSINA